MSKQWHPNHLIKKIAGFQPYNNLHELVHQATKEECQVQDDINSQAKPSMAPYTRATPSIGAPSSCKAPTTSSSRPPTSSSKPGTTQVQVLQGTLLTKQAKLSASHAKAVGRSTMCAHQAHYGDQ